MTVHVVMKTTLFARAASCAI